MNLQRQCCKCMALYTPVKGSGMIHCAMCEVAQREAAEAAETYQRKINSGDANVRCESPEDARRNRAAIRKRYGHTPGTADTKMVTHRDKKHRYPIGGQK